MIKIYIFVMVLNQTEYLDEILDKLTELGVTGGTLLESRGMAETILCNDKVPTFGGLRRIFDYCRPENKTMFSIIEDEEKLAKVQKIIEGEVCDFNEPGVGISFTIPIEKVIGLPDKNILTN